MSAKAKDLWDFEDIPDFGQKKMFVLDGAFKKECVNLFKAANFKIVETLEEAEIVAFIGGVDVNPLLYKEKALPETQEPSIIRDAIEQEAYNSCVARDIPMVGICRGAQFLHVMNGGKLWQHVTGHDGRPHLIYDIDWKCSVTATSIHHQMLKNNSDLEILATCYNQVSYWLSSYGSSSTKELEIEAGAYHDTKCFFVQGHPEVGSIEYKSWFLYKLEDFFLHT
jgi:gamma-glutamyl-gamma-aminobutyrate hydrolase PuuD